MKRQIILDTETTGIGHDRGHKIIEIGCLELLDRELTGEHFHLYLNPQRAVDPGAFKVHGISTDFLKDKPLFKSIVQDFLVFIQGAELVIHNAPFDIGFLNAELRHLHWDKKIEDVFNEALKYTRRVDFQSNSPSYYAKALNNKWFSSISAIGPCFISAAGYPSACI